ncbi:MAG TPA: class I SAM-dependent methyltransferase [Acidimicrobiales bacterium]|nr:class I SAM-dependent methyltransferase [Acidimicrobiales bacterium]
MIEPVHDDGHSRLRVPATARRAVQALLRSAIGPRGSEAGPQGPAPTAPGGLVEDSFCRDMPGPDSAVGLFAGQWSSRLPPPYEDLTGAGADLFEDGRITWAASQFGNLRDMRVLELGPLEGGHSYMLDRMGVAEVTAIEANRRAYLRCLVVKEVLGMPAAHFLCGDFMAYLRDAVSRGDRWDLCLAVGVLYHQQDPVALLELACSVSDRLLLWSHYYDGAILGRRPELAANFPSSRSQTTAGFTHTLHRHEYGASLGWQGFCGGLDTWTTWMTRADIFGALEHFGFEVTATAFDDHDHPNGPALCLAAVNRRSKAASSEE